MDNDALMRALRHPAFAPANEARGGAARPRQGGRYRASDRLGSETHLPVNLPPRMLSREAAAEYVGMSPRKFDELVGDGRMPKAIHVDGRVLWDLRALNHCCDALAGVASGESLNPWDRDGA
ncbi:hypothetical protein SAMN05444161_0026 [Rhizobiales bacterium GAS191]|nr:hypothetical protein SAMN05444161_0026 [Rhizobiales bacterium GAS191]